MKNKNCLNLKIRTINIKWLSESIRGVWERLQESSSVKEKSLPTPPSERVGNAVDS